MAKIKIVMGNPKTGKSYQRELDEAISRKLVGRKLGDHVKGDLIGLDGYEFEITGGSDHCGFPLRKDVKGAGRKKILAVSGVGIHKVAKGVRQRKTVCGNTISNTTHQVNLKILTEGKEKFEDKPKEDKKEKKEVKGDKKESNI